MSRLREVLGVNWLPWDLKASPPGAGDNGEDGLHWAYELRYLLQGAGDIGEDRLTLGPTSFATCCRVREVLERTDYPGIYKLRYLLQGAGGIGEDRLPWDI